MTTENSVRVWCSGKGCDQVTHVDMLSGELPVEGLMARWRRLPSSIGYACSDSCEESAESARRLDVKVEGMAGVEGVTIGAGKLAQPPVACAKCGKVTTVTLCGGQWWCQEHKVELANPKTSAALIAAVCDEVKTMLLTKNLRYGDSAFNPIRIFSKASPVEQLLVRIDDKLSRLARGSGAESEDVVLDLLGYLVLLRAAKTREVTP